MYSTIGTRHTDLPQLFATLDNGDWDSSDVYGSTGNKDRVCNVEGRRLTEFCENIASET
jgi:hypothetical protein